MEVDSVHVSLHKPADLTHKTCFLHLLEDKMRSLSFVFIATHVAC